MIDQYKDRREGEELKYNYRLIIEYQDYLQKQKQKYNQIRQKQSGRVLNGVKQCLNMNIKTLRQWMDQYRIKKQSNKRMNDMMRNRIDM